MIMDFFPVLVNLCQVPESGNYTFYLSCDDVCELWKHDVSEKGIEEVKEKLEKTLAKQPIITLKRIAGHNKWDK